MGHTRRQFGHLLLAGVPGMMVQRAQVGVRFALSAPAQTPEMRLEPFLALADAVNLHDVELDSEQLEAYLGAPPVPPAPSAPGGDGLAQGLLDLEEEVLRDAADLERSSRREERRAWRHRVSLAPLQALRDSVSRRGSRVISIRWSGLAQLTDTELDYAGRLARATGARTLTTEFAIGSAGRLVDATSRHGVRLGLRQQPHVGAPLVQRAFAADPHVGLALDLGAWAAADGTSPLQILRTHADRMTQVVLTDWRVGTRRPAPLGSGDARVRDVLKDMRDHRWSFPAVIETPPGRDADARDTIAAALAFCEAALLSS